jgi:hypothetical protein
MNDRGQKVNPVLANGTAWDGGVFDTPASTVLNGLVTTGTAGTAVALGTSTAIKAVGIRALATNTGLVYVGDSSVSSANGYQLSAGESVSLAVDNLASVYINPAVDSESASYIALV